MYNGFQELRNVKTQANSKIIHNEDNGNLYYYKTMETFITTTWSTKDKSTIIWIQ